MTDNLNQWDRRFAGEDYLFGTEPADFLTQHAHHLAPGSRILAVADGEGRNSVWLAGRGMQVTAMDSSAVGLDKARALAERAGVTVDFHHEDIAVWDWHSAQYDAVAAVFIQFAGPDLRAEIFRGIDATLRPGGLLLLQGYAPRQVGYGTGGPPHAENMYDLPTLHAAFDGYDILHVIDHDVDIDEGTGHTGRSAVVDFVARKPKG